MSFMKWPQPLAQEETEKLREAFAEEMATMLVHDEVVNISGFGEFSVKTFREYEGRRRKTGKTVPVPEKKLVFFKASQEAVAYVSADADSLPHFSSKVLVRRMGERVGQDSKLLSAFVSDWAGEILRRVRLG